MMTTTVTAPTLRITIVMAGTEHRRPWLETLMPLARERNTELFGLFLEDVDLLRLAALPFSTELSRLSRSERRLDPTEIERQLRVGARAAERALQDAAKRARARCSFRSVRGRFDTLLQHAARDVDLLFLSPGRPVHETAARDDRWARAERAGRSVVIACGASAGATRALEIGALLAKEDSQAVTILLLGREGAELQAERGRLEAALGGRAAEVHVLPVAGVDELIRAARRARARTLVLEATRDLLDESALRSLRERLECPALFVRTPPPDPRESGDASRQ